MTTNAHAAYRETPTARRGAHPTPIATAITLGAAATLVLWWQNTPGMHGLADWMTNAGRITGLLAGYAVIILVALMARIPALERGIGADRLSRWHAMGGRYTVSLTVAHVLLITWGYAVAAHTGMLAQAGDFLSSYPDMLSATIGAGLLLLVGIVSARAARRRLPYEIWHLLHFTTYLAIALAFAHQFSDGNDFNANALARHIWTGLYVVVAATAVWYRLLTPITQNIRHSMRVLEVHPEGDDIVSIYVTGKNLHRLRAEPGQFLRWRFLTPGLWWAANPYSLSAPIQNNIARITVKANGRHSAALTHLRPGTRVFTEGPYGAFTSARRRNRKVLLIAGGVGITPLRALFEHLPADPGALTLLYRATDNHILRRELDAIASARGARLVYLTGSRQQLGYDPLSAAALQKNVPNIGSHSAYVCGPVGFTHSVTKALREAGVRKRHIHSESFEF